MLALLAGFLTYDEEKLIKGVLFNRMAKGYYEILKPLIEEELHLPVVRLPAGAKGADTGKPPPGTFDAWGGRKSAG